MDHFSIAEFGANIQHLIEGRNLAEELSYRMFRDVLRNVQPDLQQGAFLAALVAKGETIEEIAGAWRAIDEFDTVRALDGFDGMLCENSGTGMDSVKTFNVSSAAAVIGASCGVTMARHGARAITSRCGTVDMMEAVGIDVDCDVSMVEKSITTAGIGLFNGMSAKVHPGALGRILSQIRFGSTLNIAASLANPARPSRGLRGVYAERLVEPAAAVMRMIGYRKGIVVFGQDDTGGGGMDEISVCGRTVMLSFDGDRTERSVIAPEDVGLRRRTVAEVAALEDREAEVARFVAVISGRGDAACEDFVCINAAGLLVASGASPDLVAGIGVARETIHSGAALGKLRAWLSVQGDGGMRLDRLM